MSNWKISSKQRWGLCALFQQSPLSDELVQPNLAPCLERIVYLPAYTDQNWVSQTETKKRTSLSSAENVNVTRSIFFGGSSRIGFPSCTYRIATPVWAHCYEKYAYQLGIFGTTKHERFQDALSAHACQGSIFLLHFSLKSNATESKSLNRQQGNCLRCICQNHSSLMHELKTTLSSWKS